MTITLDDIIKFAAALGVLITVLISFRNSTYDRLEKLSDRLNEEIERRDNEIMELKQLISILQNKLLAYRRQLYAADLVPLSDDEIAAMTLELAPIQIKKDDKGNWLAGNWK